MTIPQLSSQASQARVPELQVEGQLINLSEKASELLQRAGDLNVRLESVLREEGPGAEPESAPREVLVPVAERIARVVDELDDTLDILSSVMRRLEI